MTLGRPPSISLSYVDCEFPEDETTTINAKGEVEMGCKAFFASSALPVQLAFPVFRWKYAFTKDVFIPVVELTLTVTPPAYETILELDRKVREKVLPPSLNLYRSSSVDEFTTPTAYVRGRVLFQLRTCSKVPPRKLLSSTHHAPQQCCTYTAASLHRPCWTFLLIHSVAPSHRLFLLPTDALRQP